MSTELGLTALSWGLNTFTRVNRDNAKIWNVSYLNNLTSKLAQEAPYYSKGTHLR